MIVFSGFDTAVVVDVETTGFSAENDRVVSVAMVRANFSKLMNNPTNLKLDTLDVVVNPQCRIPAGATSIHGITNRDVQDIGSFVEYSQQLRAFICNYPIIAHNALFDIRFLSAEFKRSGVKTLAHNKNYCTMRRFQVFNQGRREGSNLDNVAEVMGIKGRSKFKHDAIEDAMITFEIAKLFYIMDNRN